MSNNTIPIQVYIDKETHRKLKLRAFQEKTTMAKMICGFLVKETLGYDDIGMPLNEEGESEVEVMTDEELAIAEKELAAIAEEEEKKKKIMDRIYGRVKDSVNSGEK